ncbi:MAG: hypothetical protein M1812_006687 [Candelaria pacifica]|nr:MAG: hypothetical protein M1812_006687 [Candelaria pacifica]
MPPEPARPIDPPVRTQWSGNIHSSPGMIFDSLFPSSPGSGEVPSNVRPLSMSASSPHFPLQSVPQGNLPVNPLQRFYHESNGPWNQHMIPGLISEPYPRPPNPNNLTRMDDPNLSFSRHRSTARSEIESNATGVILSDPDSGYGTKSLATASVLSADPAEYHQECPSITGHVNNLQIFHGEGQATPHYLPSNDMDYQHQDDSFEDPDPAAANLLQCPYCPVTLKCHSERKKHILRHEKPFVCDEMNCSRKEGFSTSNDLDRHKKSVHRIIPKRGSMKSYRCFSASCKTKDKLWPRLDNFRQHLKRMHQSEDTDELLRISEHNSDSQLRLDGHHYPNTGPALGNSALTNLTPREENTGLLFSANPHNYLPAQPSISQYPVDSSYGEQDSAASGGFLTTANTNPNSTLHGNSARGPMMNAGRTQSRPEALHNSFHDQEQRRHTHSLAVTTRSSATLAPLCSTQPIHPTDSKITEPSTTPVSGPMDQPEQDGLLVDQTAQSIETLTTTLAAKVAESLKIGSSDQELTNALNAVNSLQRITPNQGWRNGSQVTGDLDHWQVPDSDKARSTARHDDHEYQSSNRHTDIPEDASKTLEAQVQKILQAGLADLMSRSGSNMARTRTSPSRTKRSPSKTHLKCNEPGCDKILPRQCDMKKHKKRHEKAYGCTFLDCNKKFGSKNDWKRHENSQHFQLETWRCHEQAVPHPNNPISTTTSQYHPETRRITECARLFFRREVFVSHLKTAHNVSDEAYIKDEAQKRRIGRNGQSQFWCGFCREIVCLERKGLEAWDEKFDHVGEHFNRGLRIEAWVPVGGDRPKGESEINGIDVGKEIRTDSIPPLQQQSGSTFTLGKHTAGQNILDVEGQPSRKRRRSEISTDDNNTPTATATATTIIPPPTTTATTTALVGTEVLTFCVRSPSFLPNFLILFFPPFLGMD